jgi:exodeoxyribonuclease V gamma subunit
MTVRMNIEGMAGSLHIYVSNHLEALGACLAELVRHSPADPLEPETILVQSKGMQRWLSMTIARHNLICANMNFPFPNAFLEQAYAKFTAASPDHNRFAPEFLAFRIMALLDGLRHHEAFGPIRRYLAGQASAMKSFQLARKIAEVFDQYLVFRPDMLSDWEQGRHGKLPPTQVWQAVLWQRLTVDAGNGHRANLQKALVAKLLDDNISRSGLPRRVSVFGISHLPLFHLQVLKALSRRLPVHFFLLNPCRQYWADILSDHQLIGVRSRLGGDSRDAPADLHFERGNRLLASWGQQGRNFFELIQEVEDQVSELFKDNSASLLGRTQQDILDLVDRFHDTSAAETQVPVDQSLQVHICHSAMREVEVLYDQLLEILEKHSEIHPGDILVMTPDIGLYAPFIHAVFGTSPETGENAIPYTLADQNITTESRLVEAYLRLLQLKDSRLEVSRVMELLEYEPIRVRFGMTEQDLHMVEIWLREANVRWGWEGRDLVRYGLPRFAQNTWRAGLDRLIAGFAMASDDNELFAGILPHEGIEGSDAKVLGCLIRFAETLSQWLQQIPAQTTLSHWADMLTAAIDAFFQADEITARDLDALRACIEQLRKIAAEVSTIDQVPFEVVRQYLLDNLKSTFFGTGFLAGGVTFCAMVPMRSIPAKVICLLGLQHDAFPRESHEPGFNMIASDPRPGDRSKRNDDKYLMLEALLSAREILYISYIGRDIQDNAPKPPSVLVDELLEYIEDNYGIRADQLVIEHPLQGFSPSYFDGRNARLFSYSAENREAAGYLQSEGRIDPFFAGRLPVPEDEWRRCEFGQLNGFFSNPSKYLMEQRLGLFLKPTPRILEDREKFNLDPLSGYLISQSLLDSFRQGRDAKRHFEAIRAAGELPPGTAGRVVHDAVEDEVTGFLDILVQHLPADEPKHLDIDLTIKSYRLGGRIDHLHTGVRVLYRMASLRPKDLLTTFILHLTLNALPREDTPKTSRLVCKDAVWEFRPLTAAVAFKTLQTYLDLYWEGLQAPLPFFSRTSLEYAILRLLKNKDRADALSGALKKWTGSVYQPGESQDAYIHQCFKHADPLTGEFESLALEVYGPVLSNGRTV